MKDLLKDMTPIEYVGAAIIGLLLSTFAVSFAYFVFAAITGEANFDSASFGVADGIR